MSAKSMKSMHCKERAILKEEEKVLKEMLAKFQDQLNRLKIEELALMSQLKMQQEQDLIKTTQNKKENSNSTVGSLDSISDSTSVSSVVAVGLMYENAADLNRQQLDLNVNTENHQGHDSMNSFEEEEEEEDFEDMDGD